jgi:phosphoglycerate dehydrogenase-like enzyme
MSRKLLIWMYSPDYPLWSMPDSALERIRRTLPAEWRVHSVRVPLQARGDGVREAPSELLAGISEAEVYIGFGLQREAFLRAQRLRWVHSGAAGVGGSLFPELLDSDVMLTNSASLHAAPLAEWAVGAILHFARGFDIAEAGKAERVWRYDQLAGAGSPVHEISGRTLGILGFGGIGRAVGGNASALGMRVIALRRHPGRKPGWVDRLWGPDGLRELLAASDYVAITLPETRSTRDMLGAAELADMKRGAVLINLSRGAIVTEAALIASLREGHLRGAALDVFTTEPLPAESPLWGMENVLITPHTGAITDRFWERETALIETNIRRYLAGDPLVNRVDKRKGY